MGIPFETIVPTIITILAFSFDFLINRQAQMHNLISCLLLFPRDIFLLSLGFIASFTLSSSAAPEQFKKGLTIFIVAIIIATCIYACCRFSIEFYESASGITDKRKWIPFLITTACSWILSLLIYVLSVRL